MMDELTVTMRHVRKARLGGVGVLCAPGIHAWCMRHHVDLRELATTGIALSRVEAIPDAFAQRVAAIARAELGGQHGQG